MRGGAIIAHASMKGAEVRVKLYVPGGVVHAPAVQTRGLAQLTPHAPQLLALVRRSTQKPLHAVCPLGHEGTQKPAEHTVNDGQ
jgi:hypothetical protein